MILNVTGVHRRHQPLTDDRCFLLRQTDKGYLFMDVLVMKIIIIKTDYLIKQWKCQINKSLKFSFQLFFDIHLQPVPSLVSK